MRERVFTTRSGVRINVASDGGDGPPVVMLHGVSRRWQDWLGVVPHLSGAWSATAVDLRGHGRSDRTPGAYRIVDYVPDVVDLLRSGLGDAGPAIVFGHSLGGNVAVGVAAEAPELVRALVLEDPPLGVAGPMIAETPFLELFRVFRRHAGLDLPVATIAADLAEEHLPVAGRSGWVRFGDVRDAVALRSSAAGLKRLDPDVLEPAIAGAWLDGGDLADSLRKVACPTLLIQADDAIGGILPDVQAAEAAALIRDCVRVKFPGVGHNMHGAAVEALMRVVVPFLGSLD